MKLILSYILKNSRYHHIINIPILEGHSAFYFTRKVRLENLYTNVTAITI